MFASELAGAVVVSEYAWGEGSGRDLVSRVVAQVFPEFRWYLDRVLATFELDLPRGPVATDVLKRRGARVVEYRTPGGMEGLGTDGLLKKEAWPIDGVVVLVGDTPDLVRVNVRLPERLRWLAPSILGAAVAESGKSER
jgi:hypothetical protein